MTNREIFPWKKSGLGLAVDQSSPGMISHEVMYEDEMTHIKDRPVFMGAAIPRRRFLMMFGLVGVIATILIGRAFWMQVVHGTTYQVLAEQNRLRHDVILARRGIIRDSQGRVLAENISSFDLHCIERLLPQTPALRDEQLAKVGRVIGMSVGEIDALFTTSTDPDESLVIDRDIPYDRALALNILITDMPAFDVAIGSKRRYPESIEHPSVSHILGYVGGISQVELNAKRSDGYRQVDSIGKAGVESGYESYLRGTPGETVYEVDSRHRVTGIVQDTKSVDGQDLTLTIDLDLQRAAEGALAKGMKTAKVTRGAAVVMNPNDGSILAIVSLPAYDDNFFSGTVSSTEYKLLISNQDRPLLPRAWAGTYPSGSTAKPVIATAALAEGVITPKTKVLSTGGLHVGPWFFPDWKAGGHGLVNVRTAIAWSINTFFYEVGGGYEGFVGLGVDRLTDWMRRFGLGSKTGLDVPGEATGFVPSQDWKFKTKGERWYIGDTYNLSIGQGDLLVTPLQVASFTATVANGGFSVVPHLGKSYGHADELQTDITTTKATNSIASADVIQTVRAGMRDTVVYGSGRSLSNMPFPIAGKTGTAQWRSDKANHAWFTSFAPYDKPQVVVTVLLEEGVEGSVTAIPVAREILDAWWKKYSTTPASGI